MSRSGVRGSDGGVDRGRRQVDSEEVAVDPPARLDRVGLVYTLDSSHATPCDWGGGEGAVSSTGLNCPNFRASVYSWFAPGGPAVSVIDYIPYHITHPGSKHSVRQTVTPSPRPLPRFLLFFCEGRGGGVRTPSIEDYGLFGFTFRGWY